MTNNDLSIKSYTNLHELNKLKQAGGKNDPRALQAVAEQFESLFLNMLLKNMRQANEAFGKDGLFDSSESKFYQEMMDQQLSMSLSSGKGIGLSEVLVRQLSPNSEQPQVDKEQTVRFGQPAANPVQPVMQMMDRAIDLELREMKLREAALQAPIKPAAKAAEPGEAGVTFKVSQNDRFESPEQFVDSMLPLARKVTEGAGVAPEALVAQAALETGWGKHLPRANNGANSHNLFGIKADHRWDGEFVSISTLEYRDGVAQRERANFRAYGSYEQSMTDYLAFLQQSPRYQQALAQTDAREFIKNLQQAGYATDPDYSNKIVGILEGEQLRYSSTQREEG